MCVCTSAKHKRALTIHHPSRVNQPRPFFFPHRIPDSRPDPPKTAIRREHPHSIPAKARGPSPDFSSRNRPTKSRISGRTRLHSSAAGAFRSPTVTPARAEGGAGRDSRRIPIVKSPRRRANGTDGGGKIQSRVVPYVCTSTLSHPPEAAMPTSGGRNLEAKADC